jgi:hypothetical protein
MDGHRALPYEQNTQQSPGFGRSISWQLAHSWKKRHASLGISISWAWLQRGHVSVERFVIGPCACALCYLAFAAEKPTTLPPGSRM